MLLAEGRLPECWIPPSHILECRALLETYHDLRAEHTAWVQRIHAVLFHQGAPALGEGTLRSEQGLAALRAAAAAHLSPAGQLQVATALDMTDMLETRLHELRHQLLDRWSTATWHEPLRARKPRPGPHPRRSRPAQDRDPAGAPGTLPTPNEHNVIATPAG